ncbi:MAG: ANTAR domain-containing response regulator [Gammaproteobacteria bacterium]
MNVLIVGNDTNSDVLENALNCNGYNILKTQYSSFFFKLVKETRPDAVVFNLDAPSDRLLADLQALNQQWPVPVVMFAENGDDETIHKVIKAEVSAFVVNGLDSSHRINHVFKVAVARFKHQQALKQALEEAKTQLEDRKQIDRAKAILIKTQNFTEDEAYHTLRKLAMDRNITLGEMARNVIAMAELLK